MLRNAEAGLRRDSLRYGGLDFHGQREVRLMGELLYFVHRN